MQPHDDTFRVREIWPAGTVIKGDYVIQTKIGAGGFGTVYLAQHRFLGTMHVIKRLHEQFASDPEYVRKFVNEARAVRRLKDCPNVVEVEHMTQSEDGHLILVMEHITGGDLGGLMESRPLRVDEVVEFARQIATGLEAAHASGLVHRDIKPQNVMISHNSTGRVVLKLIDFGIAADHLSRHQTSVLRGGSIGYAAPEQWMKAGKEIDGRADLYSLGASMYVMLCGRMPYKAVDIGDWLDQVKQGAPEAPMELRSQISKQLSDLILELLAHRPEDRPSGATPLIRRLEELQNGSTVWRPPFNTGEADAQKRTTLREAPLASWMRRWRLGIAAALLAAAVAAGWFALGAPARRPDPVAAVVAKPADPGPAAQRPLPVAAEPVKAAPAVDHAGLADAAMNAGDYTTAQVHLKSLGDPNRLATLQRAVEGDAEEHSVALLDKGEYDGALRIVEKRSREFPGSKRLQAMRARIVAARDGQ